MARAIVPYTSTRRYALNLIAAFVLTSFVAAPEPKADPAKVALESLQGEWTVVESVKKGVPVELKELGLVKVVVKENTLTTSVPGERDDVWTFILDPKTTPTNIEIKRPKREVAIKGIYKLEKDKITICYAFEGEERPKDFKSPVGSSTGLFVLERVKK